MSCLQECHRWIGIPVMFEADNCGMMWQLADLTANAECTGSYPDTPHCEGWGIHLRYSNTWLVFHSYVDDLVAKREDNVQFGIQHTLLYARQIVISKKRRLYTLSRPFLPFPFLTYCGILLTSFEVMTGRTAFNDGLLAEIFRGFPRL